MMLRENLDIVEEFPPTVLWGFGCSGNAQPHTVSCGSMHAMLSLKNQGRILELHAYKYMIWLMMQQPLRIPSNLSITVKGAA